jgi:hypothetical protein
MKKRLHEKVIFSYFLENVQKGFAEKELYNFSFFIIILENMLVERNVC